VTAVDVSVATIHGAPDSLLTLLRQYAAPPLHGAHLHGSAMHAALAAVRGGGSASGVAGGLGPVPGEGPHSGQHLPR